MEYPQSVCRAMVILAGLFVFYLGNPIATHARDTILWLNDDLPPAFIGSGPDRDKGILDGVVRIYQQHLPEYEHKHLIANMPRILDLMRKGENVCYTGFLRTPEREQFILFSIPNIINFNNAIVVLKENHAKLFGSISESSLTSLLEDDRLVLGITKGRSYGSIIDGIVTGHRQPRDNILLRASKDSLKGLLAMVSEQRIDYTIGFPWEIRYVAMQIGKSDAFSVIHIAETRKERWIKNYIGCPRTEWGRRLINRINTILVDVRPSESHMQHQLKWFPKNLETDIREAYKTHILSETAN